MTPDQKTAVYAQVNANNPSYVKLLEEERAESIKYLTSANDPVMIHRAQGKVQLLDSMIAALVSAHKHLHR